MKQQILSVILVFSLECTISAIHHENKHSPLHSQTAEKLEIALKAAAIPASMAARVKNDANFFQALEKILSESDPFLRILVDKTHPLPDTYEPDDVCVLQYKGYLNTNGEKHRLREAAAAALEEMAAAAKVEGVILTVSSAYRSYTEQAGTFSRWNALRTEQVAQRISARPGTSQHQLGLVVDFGSITNEFAGTKQGRWIKVNASRFGWSLSFPPDHEELTGYMWESWHYRYVGKDLAAFIDTYFDGIQQHALAFIHEWENSDSQ
jgi:D-alanyl-D-alanine carboxypeptidase